MSFRIRLSGKLTEIVEPIVTTLVSDRVATAITDQDADLWGPEARAEASKRLGWVQAVMNTRPLVAEIVELREQYLRAGVSRFVLAGMGGSSLAPEVICATFGAPLTILDSTHPDQVRAVLGADLSRTVLIVSSKSGSTVETDSQLRTFHAGFDAIGIDARERIIIVTDPGSPLDHTAREVGYRVFNADPNVGGRFSALTAFGVVPSGLAGVDITEILDEAESAMLGLAIDDASNPGLVLGAAIACRVPVVNKLGLVPDGTHIVGLPDWIEQLLAESTGKDGTGVLPVVLDVVSTETLSTPSDMLICRLVEDAHEVHLRQADRHVGEILASGSLGSAFLTWEYAVAVAGYLMHINPFDQPDVESAKVAARSLLENVPKPSKPDLVSEGFEIRTHGDFLNGAKTLREAITATLETIPKDGYLSIMAYADRENFPQLAGVRDLVAARARRPVTFGWGPRFLHSTGQFHKGGPAVGTFIQVLQSPTQDLDVPGRSFTFGQLILAQANGDAAVLADANRPVLSITLTDAARQLPELFEAFN